jgi:hypothetical protein
LEKKKHEAQQLVEVAVRIFRAIIPWRRRVMDWASDNSLFCIFSVANVLYCDVSPVISVLVTLKFESFYSTEMKNKIITTLDACMVEVLHAFRCL